MISIVIPAFNEEKFLSDCLNSLKKQDYEGEYEIILADNGSTDQTIEIGRQFNVKIVSCPEKRSVFYARQIGANSAQGEIIIQADADVVYPCDWLKKITDHLASRPSAVAVAGRFLYRDPPFWAGLEYWLRDNINQLTVFLFGRPWLVSAATFAFRRDAFLRMNGYAGLFYSADQYGLSIRLRKAGKIIYDREIVVFASARSVEKPLLVILIDLFGHFYYWGRYLIKSSILSWRNFVMATPRRRLSAKLAPIMVIFVAFISYGYFVPTSPVFGKVYYKGSSAEKTVALTFDDGPNEPYTSEILDILDKYGIKATFFVIGQNVEEYPAVAKRIIQEGDVLANHSYSHQANHALTDYGAKDMDKAEEVIFKTLGIKPHLYRPPHGKKTPWELDEVKDQKMIEVTWDVAAPELNKTSAVSLADKIVGKVKPGKIILLHDGYGTSHNTSKANKSLTVEALPLIIEKLQAEGYSFATVPELLDVPAYNN